MATFDLGRITVVPKGNFSAGQSYEKLDVVSYNGGSYLCIINNTGQLPENTTYWMPLAKAGQVGKSAYEVAVANGFKGTEVEWLASLKPPDINKSLKLQSSNGTVFILSVDDDGKLITSKEEDSSGS